MAAKAPRTALFGWVELPYIRCVDERQFLRPVCGLVPVAPKDLPILQFHRLLLFGDDRRFRLALAKALTIPFWHLVSTEFGSIYTFQTHRKNFLRLGSLEFKGNVQCHIVGTSLSIGEFFFHFIHHLWRLLSFAFRSFVCVNGERIRFLDFTHKRKLYNAYLFAGQGNFVECELVLVFLPGRKRGSKLTKNKKNKIK